MTVEIIPARVPEDVETCVDLFYTSFNDLHRKYGYPEDDPAGSWWLRESLAHFAQTDPGGTVIAWEDERPLAFGSAHRREDYWFLSFLFVAPDAQRRGIGRSILEHLLPARHASLRRATVVEAFQLVSTMLYARYGMIARSPRYELKSLPPDGAAKLPGLAAGITREPMSSGTCAELAPLDLAMLGYERTIDHLAWQAESMNGYVYRNSDGSVAGYGYLTTDSYVGPAASSDEMTTLAVIADLARLCGDPGEVHVGVSGSSHRIFSALIDAGMRADEEHGYPFIYCSSDGSEPHPAYTSFTGFLI